MASRNAAESRSRELSAASTGQLEVDPERSLLLATEAMASASTPEALAALRGSLGASRVRETLRGHEGSLTTAGYSTDGTRIVTASIDGTARVWDPGGPGETIVLEGHDDIVVAATFSPDGSTVATASFDGTARTWDAKTGEPIAVLRHGGGAVRDVDFNPEGSTVVTVGDEGSAITWDAKTGKRLHTFSGHTGPIFDVGFDPAGDVIVTASDDGTARLWDTMSGRSLHTLKGHRDGLYRARFSPDGNEVVTASEDGTAKVWDVETGGLIATLKGATSAVADASFSPDGRSVVTASDDEVARVFDARSGLLQASLRGHQGEVTTASFNAAGTLIVTAGADGTARVWDAVDGVAVAVLRGHDGEVADASFSADGARVVTAGTDGTARIWDVSSGRTVFRGSVSWSGRDPTSDRIAISTWDGTVAVIDTSTSETTWSRHIGVPQTTASFSGDGRLVASGSLDGVIRVWDATTGASVTKLRGHDETYVGADFFDHDDLLLSWSDDGTARLWDARSGDQVMLFRHGRPPTGSIWEAHLSADGGRVFTTGVGDGIVRMWDAGTGEQLWSHDRLFQPGGIGAALSPDGRFAGTVSSVAIVWDAATGREISTLEAAGEDRGDGLLSRRSPCRDPLGRWRRPDLGSLDRPTAPGDARTSWSGQQRMVGRHGPVGADHGRRRRHEGVGRCLGRPRRVLRRRRRSGDLRVHGGREGGRQHE